jgi:hypothetical protein
LGARLNSAATCCATDESEKRIPQYNPEGCRV